MTQFKQSHTQPLLVRASQAETLGIAPATIQLPADGGPHGGISVARSRLGRGTDGPPPHYHAGSPEIFFIIDGGLQVLCGQQVHALVDLLFIMPGVERFAYFRLGDRIARGQASPQELLATQDRFDNHFLKSEIWDAHRHAEGSHL